MHDARIAELESKVADLTALVERLTNAKPTTSSPTTISPAISTTDPDALSDEHRSSRRGMLKLAGAAAAGAVAVAVVGNASPAAAATNGPMLIGKVNSPDTNEATLLFNGAFGTLTDSGAPTPLSNVNGAIYGFNISTLADTTERAGVLGIGSLFLGSGVGTAHGVLGYASSSTTGSAVYGRSEATGMGTSAGVRAASTRGPSVQLVPVATGAPTTGTWTIGAIQPDTTGRLFYCIASGTPGTWREISLPGLHIISPVRVYDSRLPAPTPGKLSTGTSRVVSIKDSRDPNTGAVLVPDIVPAGATAVIGNLTITKTVGSGGFLSVVPGDATVSSGSSINWFGPNQDLANSLTAKLDATRQVKVFCGGDSATDFVIDVTGYYL